jgi:predicted ATP-dependent serine protease
MNKVICDVCGTMYPDNAGQCPICGSSSAAVAQPVSGDGAQAEGAVGAYGYTRGGHFSKSNLAPFVN